MKEYDLLNFLMRGAGRVLERQEIMHGVWGENFYGDDNLLDVYIRYLRQKSNWMMRPPSSTPYAVLDLSSGNKCTRVSVSLDIAVDKG